MSHPAIPAELLAPPTENPCPPWCECEPGHGYESMDQQRQFRYHTGHQMRLALRAGGSADVEISSEESANLGEGDVQATAPAVQLWVTEGARLTVHEALSLSDMLARAAMLLRKIEAGQ